jgi:hypothetical protein
VLRGGRSRAVGDGVHVESYGFDLSALKVPRSGLAASNLAKDGLPTLDDPAAMPGRDVATAFRGRRKYLVDADPVIGVVLGGEARAYPLRLLNWHEVVNDVLGGRAIAVTYNPLSDGTAVFDRTVSGETLRFGVSGLLYDSNLLLYDRRPGGHGESLWSQLLAEAVAGPAAVRGAELPILPCLRTTWGAWLKHHPATSVLRPDPALLERYRRDPYGNYAVTGKPRFPADPMPPRDGSWKPMARVQAWRASPAQPWQVGLLEETGAEGSGETLYAFWFAWYATHDGAPGTLPY